MDDYIEYKHLCTTGRKSRADMVRYELPRRSVLGTAAGLSIAGLAGCFGDDDSDDGSGDDIDGESLGEGDIELEFSTSGGGVERETVESQLESYADANEDISVEFLHIPENYEDRLQTMMGADEEPDAFFVGQEAVSAYADAGTVADLEGDFDQDILDDFDQDVLDAMTPTDGLPYIPKDFQTLGVMYNREVFADAGYGEFPETWSEFRDALENIQDAGVVDYPYVEFGSDLFAGYIWYAWLAANGGQVMNDDRTECVVASEEAEEVLEFIVELREDDLMGIDSEVSAETEDGRLAEEQTAMVTGGGWVLSEAKSNYPDFEDNIGVAQPPRPDDEEYGNFVFGAGFSVSNNTEYYEESVGLVEYLLGDGIMPWLETGIAIPIHESLRDEVELYEEDDRYETFFEMADSPRLGSWEFGPHTREIFNIINPQIEGVLQGQVEPMDALETIENEVNNTIEE
ncbi:sugar ABC transporter substrate-binding protein [Halobacteria archaeon AArc-m2/3/4]|uniref:Sugar ABC transporter substrate-binding protein n=1 Tax=Natronoglomus mannanivorans TaxID=2979990 RepID=A0ABT2QJE0_9EURY|nr:sugar ABC transporter substrate-binding protein [Halobacteria archaeon AArc-m2/3/4]